MKQEIENNIEILLAVFTMLVAITNIVLMVLGSNSLLVKPFSISLSVLVFYYGWKTIRESEFYNRMNMLYMLYHLEKEAEKKAKEIIADVK